TRIAYRASVRRTVCDDRDTVAPERGRAPGLVRVEPLTHGAHASANHEVRHSSRPTAAEQLSQVAQHESGEPLHGLERDVPGETVRNDHIDFAAVDVTAFDVTDVIDVGAHLAQRRGGGAREVGAFGGFLAVGKNSDPRPRDITYSSPINGAHNGELNEIDRFDFGVGTRIDEQGMALRRGYRRRDRGTVDGPEVA